jgi:hypothetical protein
MSDTDTICDTNVEETMFEEKISTGGKVLQCGQFRHMVLEILYGVDLRKTEHKAPTYRQTGQ